jgi:hypothetical protein
LNIKGRFGLAFLIFCYVFTISLGLINVDGWITKRNIEHATLNQEQYNGDGMLDYDYLRSLSNDMVPQLISNYQNKELSIYVNEEIGAILACRSYAFEEMPAVDWRSSHPVDAVVKNRLGKMQKSLMQDYTLVDHGNGIFMRTEKHQWMCDGPRGNYLD